MVNLNKIQLEKEKKNNWVKESFGSFFLTEDFRFLTRLMLYWVTSTRQRFRHHVLRTHMSDHLTLRCPNATQLQLKFSFCHLFSTCN